MYSLLHYGLAMQLLQGWPEPNIYTVCTRFILAGKSPNLRSNTVCIFTVLANPKLSGCSPKLDVKSWM